MLVFLSVGILLFPSLSGNVYFLTVMVFVGIHVLVALGLTMLYAVSDEVHQTFVPGRVADPWDLFCDGLGAAVMLLAFGWLWRRRETYP